MTLVALKPTQQVVNIVGALGGTWRGYLAMCPCPAHQDKKRWPRLSEQARGLDKWIAAG